MSYVIAGVDEVGRGAWAGPIVAAAVILLTPIEGLADSKTLTPAKRTRLDLLIRSQALSWAIAELDASIIDDLGISEANKRVMRLALEKLTIQPDLARCDGFSCGTAIQEEVHIKGDQKFPEISAASIIAKVYRDNLMHRYHAEDPRYGFDNHVGYGTREHQLALEHYGPSSLHRRTFNPIRKMV